VCVECLQGVWVSLWWIWVGFGFGFRFGLKLIVENMEMTEMAETHDEIDQFPVPRVGPRHSRVPQARK